MNYILSFYILIIIENMANYNFKNKRALVLLKQINNIL